MIPYSKLVPVEWLIATALLIVLVALMVVTVDIILWHLRNRKEGKGCPLPPGPARLPVMGSVLIVNPLEPRLTIAKWSAKYGDIMYIRLLNVEVIVLNSTSAATELLVKRSQIYSDRPCIPTTVPYGLDIVYAFSQYNAHVKLCRRISQRTFRADTAVRFRPMQRRRAHRLIVDIIDNPEEYPSHFSMFSTAQLMSAVYDYEPIHRNDPVLSIFYNYRKVASRAITIQRLALFKVFPFLLQMPDWVPVPWIKREAKDVHAWRNKFVETPYQYAQERMESKDQRNASMVSDHVPHMEKCNGSYRPEYETALKHTSVTTLIGGIATTKSTLMTFTLAMVQNPHVWQRAQAEIDAVLGTDRLPVFDDRPSLPYVDAIIREVLRWRPVFPLGAPHMAMRSDVYKGYYIPKGAIVVPNVWAMSSDEARYPDGDKFKPERFLNAEGMLIDDDGGDFLFGFGRRICPGRHFASASLWISVATMLATLDFNLAKDADGNDITFKPAFMGIITQKPYPFSCRLTPRAHVDKEMLDRALDN